MKIRIQVLSSVMMLLAFLSCNKKDSEVTDFSWQVESIKVHADSALRVATGGQNYILSFENNKTYNFKMDINSCWGDVVFKSGNNVSFSGASCTEACCDSDFAQKALTLLLEVNKYEIDDNKLILFSDGSKRIDFVKK